MNCLPQNCRASATSHFYIVCVKLKILMKRRQKLEKCNFYFFIPFWSNKDFTNFFKMICEELKKKFQVIIKAIFVSIFILLMFPWRHKFLDIKSVRKKNIAIFFLVFRSWFLQAHCFKLEKTVGVRPSNDCSKIWKISAISDACLGGCTIIWKSF